jgi:hypothetical protein
VSTAECEFSDGLQMEEHVFWDCTLYKIQTVMILGFCPRKTKKDTQS